MTPFRSIAFVVNRSKPGAAALATELVKEAESRGLTTRTTEAYPVPRGFLEGFDACCAIGGDGTLLGVVPEALDHQTSIIGINLGTLGFLVTFTPEEIRESFAELLSGEYVLSQRTVISARSADGTSHRALNDLVIREAESRLIQLEVKAGPSLITHYSCDGLIFSSPSGSTAYNLSAGGPILHPETDAIAMTPICPHTLSNRSLILPGSSTLEVRILNPEAHPIVTMDGRHVFEDSATTYPIAIGLCSHCLYLVHRPDYDYFHTLRNKLAWGSGDR